MDDKRDDSVSSGYAKLMEETTRPSASSSWKHILIGCVLLVLFTLCGLLGGIIALRIHLQLTSSNLIQTEGQVSAYENVINNLTTILSGRKGKTQVGNLKTFHDLLNQIHYISGVFTLYLKA